MKTLIFIAVVLLAGCIAGVIQGLVNLAIVEPYLDKATIIENQHLFASGEQKDTPQFWAKYYSYRVWQKEGQLLAGAMLGTSLGALFGLVFAYSKNILPGKNTLKKALFLALIMWVAIYMIPFVKYPANPPLVGDPTTIEFRQTIYVSFIAISGFGALGFYQVYKRLSRKILAFIGYAGFISAVFIAMPNNPDPVTAPMELVNGFRLASIIAVSTFWVSLALILSVLWERLHPDFFEKQREQ